MIFSSEKCNFAGQIMIITLTGFMGGGKSAVGKALGEALGVEFVDLDAYIEHKAGRSISEIFAADGEEYFRALEAEAVRDVVVMHQIAGGDVVLALGGGTVMTPGVQDLIFGQTTCVYLRATPETLRSRLEGSAGRPLLGEDLPALLERRIPTYSRARITVDTDGLSIREVVERIIQFQPL